MKYIENDGGGAGFVGAILANSADDSMPRVLFFQADVSTIEFARFPSRDCRANKKICIKIIMMSCLGR